MELLRREMGSVSPPEKITQEAFDPDDGHLRRLVQLRPGQRAEASDLWDYAQDLRYTEIQGPLLAYLLPFCLEAWRDDLRGVHGYGGFVENFYPVLADRRTFEARNMRIRCFLRGQAMAVAVLRASGNLRGIYTRTVGWNRT